MAAKPYTGPVCYVGHDHESADGRELKGGWHYTIVEHADGHEMPGDRLVLDEDGSYRYATSSDQSHHERHHQRFVEVVPNLSDEERDRLQRLLDAQEPR